MSQEVVVDIRGQSVSREQRNRIEQKILEKTNGNKAVKVELEDGTTKSIPYDDRGLPIFDDTTKYTTTIEKPANYENMSEKARRAAEMRAATRQLREDIESGKVDASMFTENEIKDITAGLPRIGKYTWHHNAQSAPNSMQLVPRNIHNANEGGIPHSGEGSMSR